MKRWTVPAACLSVFLVAFASGQARLRAQDNSAAEQEVLKIETERLEAFRNADAATLQRIFDPEFTFTSANGEFHTLAELLSDVRSGKLKYTSMSHSDVHVRVYGDAAILTGKSGSKYVMDGKTGGAPRSYMNVYIKKNGQWRLVARQETQLAEK